MNKAYLLVWINESVQSIYLQKQANTSSLSICKANVLVWTNTSSHLQTKRVWAHFPTLPSLCIRSIHQNAPSKKNETNSKQQKKNTQKTKKNKKNEKTESDREMSGDPTFYLRHRFFRFFFVFFGLRLLRTYF